MEYTVISIENLLPVLGVVIVITGKQINFNTVVWCFRWLLRYYGGEVCGYRVLTLIAMVLGSL